MPNVPTEFKQFLWRLFEHNHALHLSDAVLELAIRKVFPSSLLDSPCDGSPTRLRVWRSEYNRGLLPFPPSELSFRYCNGVPCTGKENPLSAEQIAIRLLKFKRKRNASANDPQ